MSNVTSFNLYLSWRWKCWQEEFRQNHVDEVQKSCVYRVYRCKVKNFQSKAGKKETITEKQNVFN